MTISILLYTESEPPLNDAFAKWIYSFIAFGFSSVVKTRLKYTLILIGWVLFIVGCIDLLKFYF